MCCDNANHFVKSSEFQLIYEDKDGDWMLIGDVPWGYVIYHMLMLVNSTKNLKNSSLAFCIQNIIGCS